jgi:hypothetical protein
MARERGEITLTLNGRTWILRPTINAICALEDYSKQTFAAMADLAQRGSVSAMRLMVWSYLQERHGAEIVTPEDAGRWMSEFGSLQDLGRVLADLHALNNDDDTGTHEKKVPPVVPAPPSPTPEPDPAPATASR